MLRRSSLLRCSGLMLQFAAPFRCDAAIATAAVDASVRFDALLRCSGSMLPVGFVDEFGPMVVDAVDVWYGVGFAAFNVAVAIEIVASFNTTAVAVAAAVLPFVVFDVAFVFACRSMVLTDAARRLLLLFS